MHPKRKQRLLIAICIVVFSSTAIGLVRLLFAAKLRTLYVDKVAVSIPRSCSSEPLRPFSIKDLPML